MSKVRLGTGSLASEEAQAVHEAAKPAWQRELGQAKHTSGFADRLSDRSERMQAAEEQRVYSARHDGPRSPSSPSR